MGGLWRDTHLWGPHVIRKWERKIFLTADYTIEAYCWVIEKGTHMSYGHESADTYTWIDHADETVFQQVQQVKKVKQVGPAAFLVTIPRYQEFTAVSSTLAARDIHFVEIAGNSQITLSVIAPQFWRYPSPDAQQLFASPITTRPGTSRIVLGCDVVSLHTVLKTLPADGVVVEHMYDY